LVECALPCFLVLLMMFLLTVCAFGDFRIVLQNRRGNEHDF
jgi:hypothetical protein